MKKLLIFAAVATMFAACSKDATQDLAAAKPIDKFYATIADNDSRVQLNDACKTVWTSGDRVSVFNKTTGNRRYKFTGNTGDTVGELSYMNGGTTGSAIDKVVAIYPYNASNSISTDGTITTVVPATQTYIKNSFGVGGSIMVARSETEDLSFQNVMGWIRIALTGDQTIKSIILWGRNNELLVGKATINDDLSVNLDSNATKLVTLDCGEGVQLSTEPTYFYIAVAPQTFSKGFCVEILDADNEMFQLVTCKSVVVKRNHIVSMEESEYKNPQAQPLSNQIWYTTSDGAIITPNSYFGTIVSNTYSNGKGIITFNQIQIISPDFSGKTSLTSIILPESVKTIGDNAFYDCAGLTSIKIPSSISLIQKYAFGGCGSLASVNITDLDAWLKITFYTQSSNPLRYTQNLYLNGDLVTDLIIPNNVSHLNDYVFCGYKSLTSVTIPDNVTSIGESAFEGCTGLKSITLPKVHSIGKSAFYGCTNLTSITIPNVIYIYNYAFGRTGLTSITIPDCTRLLQDGAFYGCTSIKGFYGKYASDDNIYLIVKGVLNSCVTSKSTTYIIPDCVTKIGDYAFYDCSGLTDISLPDSVTEIGDYAFYDCSGLTDISLPNSITSIGRSAFEGCTGLTDISIPNNVTYIDHYAFSYCSKLKEVYCFPTTPPMTHNDIFHNDYSLIRIVANYSYRSAPGWEHYASKM